MTGSVTGIRRRRTVAGRRETSHLPPDRAFYGQTLNKKKQGTGGIAFNPLAYTAGQPWGDENAFDTSWVPALSVGAVYKYTDSKTVGALGLDQDGAD